MICLIYNSYCNIIENYAMNVECNRTIILKKKNFDSMKF